MAGKLAIHNFGPTETICGTDEVTGLPGFIRERAMKSAEITQIEKNIPELLSTIQAGRMISVTFKGREVARLVPPDNNIMETARKKLALLRKTAVVGDVLSPTEDEWEVLK